MMPRAALLVESSAAAWRRLAIDAGRAVEQMAIDERLAEEAEPTVRVFRWPRPAISWGYRQSPPAWIDSERVSARGIETVERPTGGGVALHGSDLSWSVVVPHATAGRLETLMQLIGRWLTDALAAFDVAAEWDGETKQSRRVDYCLTQPSPYALMARGRKLGGLAIRRYPSTWLVQGSLLVRPIPSSLEAAMPDDVADTFRRLAIDAETLAGRPLDDEAVRRALLACALPATEEHL